MTRPTTLRSLLDAGADRDPAIVTPDGAVLTHGELRAEVDRLAGRLRALGLQADDRIAIVVPNGPEMAIAFLAAACAGCAAPLNPKYRTEELRFYLDDLGAKALITRPDESGSDARDAARTADAGVLPVALTGSASGGSGLIDLIASSPATEPSSPNGRPPTTWHWSCTPPGPRRGPRSCRCANGTWPAPLAALPSRWLSPLLTGRCR